MAQSSLSCKVGISYIKSKITQAKARRKKEISHFNTAGFPFSTQSCYSSPSMLNTVLQQVLNILCS